MADVVNLKRFKKRTERQRSERDAETNRAKFGRSKVQRDIEAQRTERANHLLDQHRIDGEEKP